VLAASEVPGDQAVTVSASYTSGGVSKTASMTVTITDTAPAAAGQLTTTPENGAKDVPVNTAIIMTISGTADIRNVVNKNTFTLRRAGGDSDSSVSAVSPLWSGVCVSDGIVQGSIAYNNAFTSATFTPNCLLRYDAEYVAAVSSIGMAAIGSSTSGALSWRFETVEDGSDSDDDGGEDNEDDHPYDRRRTSKRSPKWTGKFHVDMDDDDDRADRDAVTMADAGAFLRGAKAISDTSSLLNQAGKPTGYSFPDGMISFRVEGVTPGSPAMVTLTFPSGFPAGSKVYQADEMGFHEFSGALVNGNKLMMTLDPSQDNVIVVNPIGVASPATSGSGTVNLDTAGSSGGCSVAGRTGSGGGLLELAGAYGFLILSALGIAIRGQMYRRDK
jgi:hypothetical protein